LLNDLYNGNVNNIPEIKVIKEYKFGYRKTLWGSEFHINDEVTPGIIIAVSTKAYNSNKNFSVGAVCAFGSN